MEKKSALSWYHSHKHPCIDCGKLVGSSSTRCRGCALRLRWQMGMLHPLRAGKDNPAWKGGQHKTSGGYIMIYDSRKVGTTHPYTGQHILAWEEINGKPLPKGWIVHHLNGIPSDNRPDNLVGLPGRKHYLVLQAKAKRIQELEALLNGQSQLL